MGSPMLYASAPTSDGHFYAVRVYGSGMIADRVPGTFETKAEADSVAKRSIQQPK